MHLVLQESFPSYKSNETSVEHWWKYSVEKQKYWEKPPFPCPIAIRNVTRSDL